MKKVHLVIATSFAAMALVGGCASTDYRSESYPSYSPSYSAAGYGVIDAIDMTRGGGEGIGAGAVIGGIAGGVLGHQVGSGRGNDVATVAGAIGGAVVGHQIEKNNRHDAYRIRVRMDHGGYQTVVQDNANDLRVGDRARIDNERVYRARGEDRGYRSDERGNRHY